MRKLANDLTGKKFGKLEVIGVHDTGSRKTYYVCQCDCGNVKVVRADSLISGATKSCGCIKKEQDKTNLTANHRHKMSGTRIYETWQDMKRRCYNKQNVRYNRYGGRGIKVCEEWLNNFQSFYDWAIRNGYSDDLTIDRIDNDWNYEPSNCRWSTVKEQCNNRSSNINITIGNATKSLMSWCEIFNVDYKKVHARYQRNGYESIDRLFNDILRGGGMNESGL